MDNFPISLEHHCNLISNESMSSAAIYAKDSTINSLTTFMQSVKGVVGNAMQKLQEPADVRMVIDDGLNLQLKKINYTSLQPVTVYIPHGLIIPLLAYSEILQKSQALAEKVLPETLKPAQIWFASLLASPQKLQSVSQLHDNNKIVTHSKEIAGVRTLFQGAFSAKQNEVLIPFGTAYARTADFEAYGDTLEKIVRDCDKISNPALVKAVQELSEIIDKLYMRIKQDPATYKLSNAVSASIAECLYLVAEEVEFVAAHKQFIAIADRCQRDTLAKLKQNLAP
jgi:hypothetical protein